MTPLEAFKQAQETGQIKITKETAAILEAVQTLSDAAGNWLSTFEDNMPCEMREDNKLCNAVYDDFCELYNPLLDYVCSIVGEVCFKGLFVHSLRDEFNGI